MKKEDKKLWKLATKDVRPIGDVSIVKKKGQVSKPIKITATKRGVVRIEDRIDLHGLTQNEAHKALADFLQTTPAKGVLIITGASGILRNMVPLWLESPLLSKRIISASNATQEHGGIGALYLRLRAL